jgi:hypothetical protein
MTANAIRDRRRPTRCCRLGLKIRRHKAAFGTNADSNLTSVSIKRLSGTAAGKSTLGGPTEAPHGD